MQPCRSYPVQQYIHMAQVRYSEEDDTKKVDWMFSAMAPHLLTDDGHFALHLVEFAIVLSASRAVRV